MTEEHQRLLGVAAQIEEIATGQWARGLYAQGYGALAHAQWLALANVLREMAGENINENGPSSPSGDPT